MACTVCCVWPPSFAIVGQLTAAIIIPPFILSALRAALSLSSSSSSGLPTALKCDVYGHTALAVYRVGAKGTRYR